MSQFSGQVGLLRGDPPRLIPTSTEEMKEYLERLSASLELNEENTLPTEEEM